MTHCININSASVNPTMEITVRKVRTDRIDIQAVYDAHASMGVEDFKDFCIEAIIASSGKVETKRRTYNAIARSLSKDNVLNIVNNYWLAGQGLKV